MIKILWCNQKKSLKLIKENLHYLHSKNESLASKPLAVAANDVWLDKFRDRLHSVDRNDGIGKSKLIPLSTEVRLTRRCDSKLVIVGKFADNDDIGELIENQTKNHTQLDSFKVKNFIFGTNVYNKISLRL